jgi:hypothetical protein
MYLHSDVILTALSATCRKRSELVLVEESELYIFTPANLTFTLPIFNYPLMGVYPFSGGGGVDV